MKTRLCLKYCGMFVAIFDFAKPISLLQRIINCGQLLSNYSLFIVDKFTIKNP